MLNKLNNISSYAKQTSVRDLSMAATTDAWKEMTKNTQVLLFWTNFQIINQNYTTSRFRECL